MWKNSLLSECGRCWRKCGKRYLVYSFQSPALVPPCSEPLPIKPFCFTVLLNVKWSRSTAAGELSSEFGNLTYHGSFHFPFNFNPIVLDAGDFGCPFYPAGGGGGAGNLDYHEDWKSLEEQRSRRGCWEVHSVGNDLNLKFPDGKRRNKIFNTIPLLLRPDTLFPSNPFPSFSVIPLRQKKRDRRLFGEKIQQDEESRGVAVLEVGGRERTSIR